MLRAFGWRRGRVLWAFVAQFALLGATLAALGMDLETSFDEPQAEVRITPPRSA